MDTVQSSGDATSLGAAQGGQVASAAVAGGLSRGGEEAPFAVEESLSRAGEEASAAAAEGLSPAGAAPAVAAAGGAAESQRRRSSVAVVSVPMRSTASVNLGGRLSEQLRHTAMALGLSLLVAPLQLLSEVLVRLALHVLPNVRPSPPCGRLLMDDTSTTCVAALVIAVSFFQCSMGLVLVGPLRTAPHVLVGTAAHILFLVWYSSLGLVAMAPHFVLCFSGIALHIFMVTVSVKLKGRLRRAPRALKESVAFAALGVFFCVACAFYIVLSDRLNSLAGFAVTGLGYPAFSGLARRLLQNKLKSGARLDRLDLHGMIMLSLAIIFLTPQFFVLTSMDSTLSFLISAASNFTAELVGSALFVRAARADLDPGVAWLGRSTVRKLVKRAPHNAGSQVRPSELSASAIKAESANPPAPPLQGAAAALDNRRHITRLFVATKVAHEDLGERIAIFVGCGMAFAYTQEFVVADAAAKVLLLVLLEMATDIVKVAIYAASNIDIGRVRFNVHVWGIIAVALAGGTGCGACVAGVRISCMIGDGVGALLG